MAYTVRFGKIVSAKKASVIDRSTDRYSKAIYSSVNPKLHPDKGMKNGRCNVTACQKPGAIYYNKSTRKYYCEECAEGINWPGGRADTMALYGTPLLCETDEEMEARESAKS